MAYRAERNTLYRYQGKRSDVAVCHDFHAANDPDKYYPSNPAFKVKRISKYGTQVHLSDANVIAHFATINYNYTNKEVGHYETKKILQPCTCNESFD